MTILPSPRTALHELLARLDAPQARARDAAAARLRLLGAVAVRPLLEWLRTASPEGRRSAIAVLEALEGDETARHGLLSLCADLDASVAARALEAALERSRDSPRAAAECTVTLTLVAQDGDADTGLRVSALAGLLRLLRAGVDEALEPLLVTLLDEGLDDALRLAAAPVLAELKPVERKPLLLRLLRARSPALRAMAGARDSAAPSPARAAPARPAGAPRAPARARSAAPNVQPPTGADLDDALSALERLGAAAIPSLVETLRQAGGLEDAHAERAAAALARVGAPAVPALQRALDDLGRVRDPAAAAAVAAAKAVLHLALLRLDSRIALYDLREMLAARPPRALPRLLAAAAGLGDASVAVELARLVAAAPELRADCAPAFAAIVAREKLTRRHRAWKALDAGARAALDTLWPAGRRG